MRGNNGAHKKETAPAILQSADRVPRSTCCRDKVQRFFAKLPMFCIHGVNSRTISDQYATPWKYLGSSWFVG